MPDPLTVIAESYRGIHETTQVIAQAATKTHLLLAETVRLYSRTLWLQGLAFAMLGLGFLGIGSLAYLELQHRQEQRLFEQALLRNSQDIAAQTAAILRQLPPAAPEPR